MHQGVRHAHVLRDNLYADSFSGAARRWWAALRACGRRRVGVVARAIAAAAEWPRQPGSLSICPDDGSEASPSTRSRRSHRVWVVLFAVRKETVGEAYESRKKWPAAQ